LSLKMHFNYKMFIAIVVYFLTLKKIKL